MFPIFAAPAVWELDGPTMMGPMMSNEFIVIDPLFRKSGDNPASWKKECVDLQETAQAISRQFLYIWLT